MKRWIAVFSMMAMICCGVSNATVSVVKNGSFENDGYMEIKPASRPEYWCDVSYNEAEFVAYLDDYWATDGVYSLALFNKRMATFQSNSATISQSVYLVNADQIAFDMYLSVSYGNWNVSVATARVLIDGSEVWNSDGLVYVAGQFDGRVVIDVNQIFKNEEPHILSLQLGLDVSNLNYIQYYAQWDAIALNSYCGGTGYLPADLTHDCVVDINDLNVFADGWLEPDGPDLTGDNKVDFKDFAVFADSWMVDNRGEPFIPGPDFVFLDGDLNDDGIVDYVDISIFSDNWLGQGGACVREDLNEDGYIDFKDLASLAGQWQQTGDLYGL